MGRYIVGLTGASGSVYGITLVKELLSLGHEVFFVASALGEKVAMHEMEMDLKTIARSFDRFPGSVRRYENDDLFAPIASGSYPVDGMFICPCSMSTLGRLASGSGGSLITRCADVCIKEKRKLLLLVREAPLSSIHLENMLKLSNLGVMIFPPVPALYHAQNTIDDLVKLTV